MDAVAVSRLLPVAVAIAFAIGCGGQVGGPPDGGGCTAPKPQSGAGAPNPEHVIFAVDTFLLGDSDPDGQADPDAWRSLGYDLDAVDTQNEGTESCAGILYPDGVCGVDNVFGAFKWDGFVSNKSSLQTAWARAGRWTWLIELKGFANGGTFGGATVQLHVGAPLGSAPRLDGTDVWSPALGMDSNEAVASVDDGTVVANPIDTWIDEPLNEQPDALHRFHAPLHAVAMQFSVSADESRITSGVIAGVIDPSEIDGTDLPCMPGGSLDFGAYDDVHRGLQNDRSTACDAWSFAIGFTAVRAELGQPMAPLPAPTDCTSP